MIICFSWKRHTIHFSFKLYAIFIFWTWKNVWIEQGKFINHSAFCQIWTNKIIKTYELFCFIIICQFFFEILEITILFSDWNYYLLLVSVTGFSTSAVSNFEIFILDLFSYFIRVMGPHLGHKIDSGITERIFFKKWKITT